MFNYNKKIRKAKTERNSKERTLDMFQKTFKEVHGKALVYNLMKFRNIKPFDFRQLFRGTLQTF
jgi:hypothetical protein